MVKKDLSTPYIGKIEESILLSTLKSYALGDIFILVDSNTHLIVRDLIKKVPLLKEIPIIEVKNGEENKNISSALQIWDELTKNHISRSGLLLNFGGGMITDIGGFIASTYKRGIDFINIPTTLLAIVDASIGGKTGIDLDNFKNQVGTFCNAKAVFCDVSFLKTLPQKELISGFAEVLKHGLIKDKNYWNYCISTHFEELDWEKVISSSIKIKLDIVATDPTEKDERKLLNFGHTIGHAIETHLMNVKTPILHGEAVAIGMICESYISNKTTGLSDSGLEQITDSILNIFPKTKLKTQDFETLIALMQNDKKNDKNGINFSLLSRIGEGSFNQTCNNSLIKESLAFYTNL